jgi:hypothetical protein
LIEFVFRLNKYYSIHMAKSKLMSNAMWNVLLVLVLVTLLGILLSQMGWTERFFNARAQDVATLFDKCGFSGKSVQLAAGTWDTPRLRTKGLVATSFDRYSLRVPSGVEVTIAGAGVTRTFKGPTEVRCLKDQGLSRINTVNVRVPKPKAVKKNTRFVAKVQSKAATKQIAAVPKAPAKMPTSKP